MEKIYRIQDRFGRGPFKPGFSKKWVELRPDHENLQTWIQEFGRVDFDAPKNHHVGCGCRTIEQLKRWFNKSEYEKLKRNGYNAVVVKVDNVLAESDIQLVFSRKKALKKNITVFNLY